MNKIYLVIMVVGEYEDKNEYILRAFTDINRANDFMARHEATEQKMQNWAKDCLECAGSNKTCPFYAEPTHLDDGCENYSPYHTDATFKIVETELEE